MIITRTELVFIPFPLMGHLPSTVEIAKLLTQLDPRLSITIIIMQFPSGSIPTSIPTDSDSIRCVTLPSVKLTSATSSSVLFYTEFAKAHKPLVKDAVQELTGSDSVRLAGFVVDMFCTPMIDVAHELGVPSYLFYASSAAFLGFLLHLQFLHSYKGLDLDEFKGSDTELHVPSFANGVPGKVFPSVVFGKGEGGVEMLLYHTRRFRQVKGITGNTFVELESHAIQSFSGSAIPPVYPVGPILINTQMRSSGEVQQDDHKAIISWLHDQPPSSVVFLCFGSMGSFSADQIKEIAIALEQSGYRFLWTLHRPSNRENPEEGLPEGFLRQMEGIGKVIGWASQMAVLGHAAVGGFVSHCRWNSLLESIWHGVPVATWPLFGDQQINAFQMVKDLGLAVEIKNDYNRDSDHIVSAHEIENGLKRLMDINSDVRKHMKEMQKISGEVMIDGGGSSYVSLRHFVQAVMAHIPCKATN